MDKQELRLELIKITVAANNMFKDENVIQVAKNYEAYVTSGEEDKAQVPSDIVKEQQKGRTVSSKKRPR